MVSSLYTPVASLPAFTPFAAAQPQGAAIVPQTLADEAVAVRQNLATSSQAYANAYAAAMQQQSSGAVSAPTQAQVSATAATAMPITPAASPVGVATTSGSGVSGARSQATHHGSEIWAGVNNPRQVHVTQVQSKYNPNPTPDNRNCGPASVLMGLRMVGVKVPGVSASASPASQIERVRQLTGNASASSATTNYQLEAALKKVGVAYTQVSDDASIRASIMAGDPVVLNGNPSNPGSYENGFSSSQMERYNGAHWILVSGLDQKTGDYIINDPLSMAGAVEVTPKQLSAYRGGSLGIVLERP